MLTIAISLMVLRLPTSALPVQANLLYRPLQIPLRKPLRILRFTSFAPPLVRFASPKALAALLQLAILPAEFVRNLNIVPSCPGQGFQLFCVQVDVFVIQFIEQTERLSRVFSFKQHVSDTADHISDVLIGDLDHGVLF